MADSTTARSGPGVLSILGVAFVVLKLIGEISWSWWWVTLPFWGGFVGLIALAIILFLIVGTSDAIVTTRSRKNITKRRY